MVFTVGALESGLEQSWKYGLPSCMSHDLHRLIAWSKGMSLYLEPGLVRLAGLVYLPEDTKDEEELQQIFQSSIQARLQDDFKPHSEELYKRLSKLLSKEHNPLTPAYAALVDNGLAVQSYSRGETKIWEDFWHGLFLGSQKFIDRIKSKYLLENSDVEIPQKRQVLRDANPENILKKAARVLKCNTDVFLRSSRISDTNKLNRYLFTKI
ncbi:MAG: hypothetical protein H8D23_36030 [Candidatus Brocadiales bacterium]|nr:hypothetical protein [Candidatus Brocadiales bacterium]